MIDIQLLINTAKELISVGLLPDLLHGKHQFGLSGNEIRDKNAVFIAVFFVIERITGRGIAIAGAKIVQATEIDADGPLTVFGYICKGHLIIPTGAGLNVQASAAEFLTIKRIEKNFFAGIAGGSTEASHPAGSSMP